MAKRKAETEAVAPADGAVHEKYSWWESERFQQSMGDLLKRLAEDKSLIPCQYVDEKGIIWFYTGRVGKDGKVVQVGEAFNNSHPCPPFCPEPPDEDVA